MMKRFLLVLLLSTLPCWCNPSASTVSAHTDGDTVRLVIVDVVVENRSDEPTPPALLLVTCTPQVRKDPKNKGTVKDAQTFREMVPELKPKERKTISVRTQYTSKNSFRGQRSTFRALNIDPTREVTVKFQAEVAQPSR